MNTPTPRLIEVFRAGKHTDSHGRSRTWTGPELQACASAYDPTLQKAPIVIGHPKMDAPAFGQAARFVYKDERLYVEEDKVEPQFNAMRNDGRFTQRSMSFYAPDAPNNPKPGVFYPKHIGWLGAAAPSVTGLEQVSSFAAEEDGAMEYAFASDRRWAFRTIADIFRRWREKEIEEKGIESADEILPAWQIDALNEAGQPDAEGTVRAFSEATETDDREVQYAARVLALEEREQRVSQAEQQNVQAAQQARRDEAMAFADGLIADGCRIKPVQKATVVELILAMPVETTLSFGEGDDHVEQPAVDLFRSFLSGLQKSVDFAEKAGSQDDDTVALEFAAPPGATVSADRGALYSKAKAYQREHPGTDWAAAVAAVGG